MRGRAVRRLWLLGAVVITGLGCATSSLAEGMPQGAHLVGGGSYIEFTATEDGIAYIVNPPQAKVILTKSLKVGDTLRWNDGSLVDEKKNEIFRSTVMPGQGSVWELFFAPERNFEKKEGPPSEGGAGKSAPEVQPPGSGRS